MSYIIKTCCSPFVATTSEKKFAAKETLAPEPERESEGELCAEI